MPKRSAAAETVMRLTTAPVRRRATGAAGVSEDSGGAGIQGLERAMAVLNVLASAQGSGLGVTEIAARLGLAKGVVHRILSALRARGYVESDPATRRYLLGPEVLLLGLSYLDRLDVRAVAHEAMTNLMRASNETSTLAARVGMDFVFVDQVTPSRPVKLQVQVGKPLALHCAAAGVALLAFLPEGDREDYLHRVAGGGSAGSAKASVEQLRTELAAVREQGYATSINALRAGSAAVAAPIFGYDGVPAGTISVAGPVERFVEKVEECAKLLLAEVQRVSARLGYPPAISGEG